MAIKLVALGDSFRSVSRQLDVIREESGIAVYGGASDTTVATYIRICMAASLQKLSEIMVTCWAMSIAFDCSTHQTRSYLDLRVRFFHVDRICNYHLIALPMFERHTGANMSDLIVKFLDALFPEWKSTIVGISTDGDRSMTGRIRGVVTSIERMLQPGCVRVWCGLHQLDLVMQKMFEAAFDERYLGVLTKLIGYLRRQQNLITTMRSECPKFCTVRWLSMGKVLSWLVLHRLKVQEYLLEKNLDWNPSNSWWVFTYTMHEIVKEADIVFQELQGMQTLILQQRVRLKELVNIYCSMSQMEGPLSEEVLQNSDLSLSLTKGGFRVKHAHVRSFMDGLGRWVLVAMDEMEQEEINHLMKCIALVFLNLADGISAVVAERDSSNDAAEELPAVLPHQLVTSDMRTLVRQLEIHNHRLKRRYSDEEIQMIDKDYADFTRAVRMEPALKESLNAMKNTAISFQDAWSVVGSRFRMLKIFCGGIATVFPNTATVESDFSRLGLEKNEYRHSLTDFSLEGVLHSKQYGDLLDE